MKDFDFIQASDELKEKTLAQTRVKPKKTVWKTVSVIAACLVCVLAIGAVLPALLPTKGKATNNAFYADGELNDAPKSKGGSSFGDLLDGLFPSNRDGKASSEGKMPADPTFAPEVPGPLDESSVEIEKGKIEKPEDKQPEAGSMTAARLNDNVYYAEYREKYEAFAKTLALYNLGHKTRTVLTVKDKDGAPVNNAAVTVRGKSQQFLSEAVTDSKGFVYFFDLLDPNELSVSLTLSDGNLYEQRFAYTGQSEITLDIAAPAIRSLDVMFMIDTTGSMGDELIYLQKELAQMITQLQTTVPTRLSVNFYRDLGDEYVVRDFGFTSEIAECVKQLNAQEAAGGGDEPEALDQALDHALSSQGADHAWTGDVKLLFVVLDAPAHTDAAVQQRLKTAITKAQQIGVRIIPVVASTNSSDCGVLCRELAVVTGGQYVFLTDHSGIGDAHTTPDTTVAYEVKPLIDTLNDVIRDYLK